MPHEITLSSLFSPTPRQQEAIAACDAHKYVFFGGAAGGGKAGCVHELVWMRGHRKPMGDVRVGDVVCTPSGQDATVIAVHPQGDVPLYRVHFSDGVSTRCTLDHRWLVAAYYQPSGWLDTCELTTSQMRALLEFRLPSDKNQYAVTLRIPRAAFDRDRSPREVVAITEDGHGEAQCITLDSEDGLYLQGEHGIVTHNSHLIRWYPIRKLLGWAKRGFANVRCMVACETYSALQDRHLHLLRSGIMYRAPLTTYPDGIGGIRDQSWLGKYNDELREFHLRPEYGSGVVAFRNLDDPTKYLSSEWAIISIDEMPLNPSEQVFLDLKPRLRQPPIPTSECSMLCAGNPMGPGIAWVKRRWIDRVLDEYDDPNDYAFVQSLATDNPYIDQEYIRSLETQPEDRRNAMLFGSWTSFMGQYFTEFSKKTHVVEPFDIPRGHGTWYGGLDWGFSPDPAYFGLFWLSPEKVLYLVRELCVNRHTPSQLALAIKALCGENKPVVTIAGKDIWAEGSASKETGASIAAVLANNGVPCFPANTDRLNGWARVHEWLRPYDVPVVDETMGTTTYVPTAQFKIFSSCPEMIRSIENAVHDKVRAQDINTHGFDHPIDQLRYVCQHLPAPQVLTISTARITLDSEDFWRQLKEQAGCIVTHSHDPKKEGKHAGW